MFSFAAEKSAAVAALRCGLDLNAQHTTASPRRCVAACACAACREGDVPAVHARIRGARGRARSKQCHTHRDAAQPRHLGARRHGACPCTCNTSRSSALVTCATAHVGAGLLCVAVRTLCPSFRRARPRGLVLQQRSLALEDLCCSNAVSKTCCHVDERACRRSRRLRSGRR